MISFTKNSYHSQASFRDVPPSHHNDDTLTEAVSTVRRTRVKERKDGEEEEEEEEEEETAAGEEGETVATGEQGEDEEEQEEEEQQQKAGSSAPDCWAWQDISGLGDRSAPSPSSTERQDQHLPPYIHDPESTSTDVGSGPASEAHPDLDLDDEGYVESNGSSANFATSVDSVVEKLVEENERRYPSYGRHEYGLPVDEREKERMALQHKKFYLVLGRRHFLSPIGDYPQRILDLGTGTGLWVFNVAEQFPTAAVIGVDVANIQPQYVPPNCSFEIQDIEEPWGWRKDSFDFIHMRDPFLVSLDWEKLANQCLEHLKPGGWYELACTYLAPASDGGRMPDSSEFRRVCKKLVRASKVFGAPADCPLHFVEQLQRAGFVHVTKREFRIPSCPWSDDERLKEIGTLEQANLLAGASTFGLRVFERAFGWPRAKTEVRMVAFRRDLANPEYRQYCTHFVIYGQKPSNAVGS